VPPDLAATPLQVRFMIYGNLILDAGFQDQRQGGTGHNEVPKCPRKPQHLEHWTSDEGNIPLTAGTVSAELISRRLKTALVTSCFLRPQRDNFGAGNCMGTFTKTFSIYGVFFGNGSF